MASFQEAINAMQYSLETKLEQAWVECLLKEGGDQPKSMVCLKKFYEKVEPNLYAFVEGQKNLKQVEENLAACVGKKVCEEDIKKEYLGRMEKLTKSVVEELI